MTHDGVPRSSWDWLDANLNASWPVGPAVAWSNQSQLDLVPFFLKKKNISLWPFLGMATWAWPPQTRLASNLAMAGNYPKLWFGSSDHKNCLDLMTKKNYQLHPLYYVSPLAIMAENAHGQVFFLKKNIAAWYCLHGLGPSTGVQFWSCHHIKLCR